MLLANPTALMLRSDRRSRLEVWSQAPSVLPSFETGALRPPQSLTPNDIHDFNILRAVE